MQETKLLIEEWEADIVLLESALRHTLPLAGGPEVLVARRDLAQELSQAREAQGLLYSLLPLLAAA